MQWKSINGHFIISYFFVNRLNAVFFSNFLLRPFDACTRKKKPTKQTDKQKDFYLIHLVKRKITILKQKRKKINV